MGYCEYSAAHCMMCELPVAPMDFLYEISKGEWVCEECLLEWAGQLTSDELADRMDIPARRAGSF